MTQVCIKGRWTYLISPAKADIHTKILLSQLLQKRRQQRTQHLARPDFLGSVLDILLRARGDHLPEVFLIRGRPLISRHQRHRHLVQRHAHGSQDGREKVLVVRSAVLDFLPGVLVVDEEAVSVQKLNDNLASAANKVAKLDDGDKVADVRCAVLAEGRNPRHVFYFSAYACL